MDRVEFCKSIKSKTPLQDIIIDHFDPIMALYDLVYSYEELNIEGDFQSGTISFKIVPEDPKLIKQICTHLQGQSISKYGRTFTCSAQHYSNSLFIILQ